MVHFVFGLIVGCIIGAGLFAWWLLRGDNGGGYV
jgi:hypothetical protein